MSDKQYIKTLEEEIEKLRHDKEVSIKLAEQNEQLIRSINDRESMIHSLRCEVKRLESRLYERDRSRTTREILEEQQRYDVKNKYYQYGSGYTYDDPKQSNPFYDLWSEDEDEKPKKKRKKK